MLQQLLPTGFEMLMIQGMSGVLEVCVSVPKTLTPQTPLLLVSHPHPLHGGSLHNKVVQTVAKAGQAAENLVVCFNFRGVGNSSGVFDHGHGERYDLKDVRAFALAHWGERPIVMAGFSFGAWISALVAESLPPKALILIAPPVSLYPMERVHLSTIPTTVIQGGQDEVTSAEASMQWAKQQLADVFWRDQASHYFHGQLLWLRRAVTLVLTV